MNELLLEEMSRLSDRIIEHSIYLQALLQNPLTMQILIYVFII